MIKHTFSDFSYAVNIESKKKKHKEILVCFIYNGVEVLKKVYVPEGRGVAYVFEAKRIIDQEMRDGSLAVYSHKFIFKNRKKGLQPKKIVDAVAKGEKASSVPLAPTKVATAKTDAPKESTPKGNGNKKWLIIGGCAVVVVALVLGTYFLTKSLTKPGEKEYPVSFETTGCEYQGDPVVKIGEKYECIFTPKADESVAIDYVKMGSKNLETSEYTFVDNVLTIQKVADANIAIKAHTTPLAYQVTFNGVGCALKEGSTTTIAIGGEYECDIIAERTTESPVISEITMNGTPITSLDYTFTGSHLHINKGATGPINITAGVETTVFNVSCDYPSSAIVFVGENTVKKGQDYGCKIESRDSKKAVNIDKVRMGSTELIPGPSADYQYDINEKQLHISKRATADISIVVSAVDAFYDVTYIFGPNCEKVSGPDTIAPGATLNCTFKAQEAPRRNTVTGVTIGGRKLDPAKKEYYFDEDTNELNVTTGATGNIVISVTSYDPGTDKFKATFDAGADCKDIDEITGIQLGSELIAHLEVADSVKDTKKVRVDAVVMGGIALKEGEQYTFDPTALENNFKVLSVTNNVLIKFSAVDIGQIVATPNYELSEDHYIVKSFTLPAGKSASDVESITIDPVYPSASNDGLPVTEIARGALNEFTGLQELSIPFIGGKYLAPGEETPMDGSQLFGHIFGDTPHAGLSATWQYYYDAAGVQHPRKFIIPNTLRYVTITGDNTVIPAGAFSGCRDILNIEFKSNTVSTIENSAFQNCESLRDIIIPTGVTMIQDCAFQNCTDLKHINLPSGLTTIGRYAFNGCTGFSRIYLNDSIIIVGEAAFSNVRYGVIACSKTKASIEKIDTWSKNWVDAATTVVYGATGIDDYISTTNFHYMLVKNDDGQTGAFVAEYLGDSAASEITIPYSVDNKDAVNEELYPIFGLGNNMFSEYTATTKFKFECTDLTSIGSYCFAYCYALNNLDGFNELTNLNEIGSYAFGACTSLKSINVPTSVSSIGEYAFAYTKVETFDLSTCTNLKSINTGVFYYCYETTSITLPEGLTYLGENIFEGCYKLTSLELNTSGIDTIPYALMYCANDLEHPERVSQLQSFTWVSNTKLKTIGGSAFGGCSKLTSITFGSATANHIPSTVGTIGDYAFTRCTSITNIYIDHGTATGDVSNINMGLEVFKAWTASQSLHLPSAYVTGGGFLSTEATTPWGWNLSRGMLEWGYFTCSKSGSVDLVITTN